MFKKMSLTLVVLVASLISLATADIGLVQSNTRTVYDGVGLSARASMPNFVVNRKSCLIDSGSRQSGITVGAGHGIAHHGTPFCCKDLGTIEYDSQNRKTCRAGCPDEPRFELHYFARDVDQIGADCLTNCFEKSGCKDCLTGTNIQNCTEWCKSQVVGTSGGRCANPGSNQVTNCCECVFN
ncbi:hypothetical protein H696_01983 [Fonticula alba]|uniref:Uncharacterized protein n=1 Tax=Fonticula alba TaxID=691883 RepID=A0A058Z9Y3_FONAL|nr:hypothetical protein H696_01983 [Fonticula alba]KCV71035.1 hypothetical protein H696_01983 [Fonticula alba]|eukprot:XP_009494158.1 hypothetical protein H696_01983 [Fonticula alba]